MIKKFASFLLVFAVLLTFWCCFLYNSDKPKINSEGLCSEITLKYAENFGIDSCDGFTVLWVKNGLAPILKWVILDSSFAGDLPHRFSEIPVLHIPAKRIAVLSSTYLGYLINLGVSDKVIAVDSKKYIADSSFYYFADSTKIAEVGEGMELSPEEVYALNADVIFAFSVGENIYDAFPKLARLKLPVVLTSEWSERSPLAKAEWLKFFGLLTGKYALADSLFNLVDINYLKLRKSLDSLSISVKPLVFTGVPYSGIWYASPGKSFMSSLISDAGGRYVWENDSSEENFSMPFEKAFSDVCNADFWLNPGGVTSVEELAGMDERIKLFDAWKNGKVFEYDLKKGPAGGVDFYEGAVVRPDLLLKDMIKVLHPELFKDTPPIWYRNLSNL